jgi:signal peptide peptidase SppA
MSFAMGITESIIRLPGLRRLPRAPRVPVVRLAGAIGDTGALRRGLTLAGVAEPLGRAFAMPGISAVAILVNSPGGSPVQSALIAKRIRDLAEEKDVRVHAFCEDAAASGGYWLACAGDDIHAMDSSIVGSIGVVSAGFGFQDLIQRYGIERRVHASGERKVILDPFRPEDPDDVAHLESLQAEIHESFKAMVRERRKGQLNADEASLFNGQFWTGKRAFELGLVDGLGDARAILRGKYGEKTRLIPVPVSGGWLRRGKGVAGVSAGIAGLPQDWAGDLLGAAEERALWQRLGL